MDEPRLIFMCRVESGKTGKVVFGFETFKLIPVRKMSGFMDVFIGPAENSWLEQQCDFDR
jgi:hypothetical protein